MWFSCQGEKTGCLVQAISWISGLRILRNERWVMGEKAKPDRVRPESGSSSPRTATPPARQPASPPAFCSPAHCHVFPLGKHWRLTALFMSFYWVRTPPSACGPPPICASFFAPPHPDPEARRPHALRLCADGRALRQLRQLTPASLVNNKKNAIPTCHCSE